MDDDAVKNFIPFRVSAEEPLFEVGCIQSVVFGDFIAVRVDPFSTVDAGRDRIVFAMIMQLYPLNADTDVPTIGGSRGNSRPVASSPRWRSIGRNCLGWYATYSLMRAFP